MRASLARLVLALSAVAALATAGCGPTCQSTCNRLYQEDECNLQSAGLTREELISTCMEKCENALDREGDLGDYDPNQYTPANETVELENDKQAAAWMECVASTACCQLGQSASQECASGSGGYCAPVW